MDIPLGPQYRIRDVHLRHLRPVKGEGSWGELERIIDIQSNIPEFTEPKDIMERIYWLSRGTYLILLTERAEWGDPVGCLIGYWKNPGETDPNFYLWIGGITPNHRRKGLMSCMMDVAEWWAREARYKTLSLKTFPKFDHAIQGLEKRGFQRCPEKDIDGMVYEKDISSLPSVGFRHSDVYKKWGGYYDSDLTSLSVSWDVGS